MFRGANYINMDAKGRVAIPTRHRERLDELSSGQLVVTIEPDERCLLIYPLPNWEDIQRKVEALPSFNAASRRVQRLLIGYATDIQMDGSGRILLPVPLREYAQLDKKLVMLGQGNKFELWSEEVWLRRNDSWLEEDAGRALPPELENLSL